MRIRNHINQLLAAPSESGCVPSVAIGTATYPSMSLNIGDIVIAPSGTSPNGFQDTYNPADRQLTVQSATVGETTYYNAVVTVESLRGSAGEPIGTDTYDGTTLKIPFVQVLGGPEYHNVAVTISRVDSVASGMPTLAEDEYLPASHQLMIPAVNYNGNDFYNVFTNVVVTVAKVVSIGGETARKPSNISDRN